MITIRPIARLGGALAVAALAAAGTACSGVQDTSPLVPLAQTPSNLLARGAERSRFQEFNDLLAGSAYYGPSAIASGTNGDVWVTDVVDQDFGENAVIHVAASGAQLDVFYYGGVISEGSDLIDLVLGPDGALWITDYYNGQILRMTTDGSFTNYPLGSSSSGNAPVGIATGPDGALWFVGSANFKPAVGRITTSGKITFYTSGISSGTFLQDIAAGPDGAMWFTEPNAGKIGRITMRGKVTEYSNGITTGSYPWSITTGPDKALWFTELLGGRIGRITTKGHVEEFSKGITPTEEPVGIAAGPHRALWFTEYETYGSYQTRAAKVGRITTAGSIHEFSGFDPNSAPGDIAAGNHQHMWFVELATNKLGRVHI